MTQKEIVITTEFITLGALLKYVGLIQQGSEASAFLSENKVLVNNEIETRRGKKIYPGYKLEINHQILLNIVK